MQRSDVELGLGAFALDAPIGRGGMAEVWRGHHRESGTPVAVKLVTDRSALERTCREALRNEVRAMARLDHPGIVLVLDYGQVPPEVAARDERLLEGSPYLVMELIGGGPLGRAAVRDWPSLARLLAKLLEALAHAHARGVIHRDLKPSNILMGDHGPTLVDFGIAHALERTSATRGRDPMSGGTAGYMAPEQILGLARDEGPWTDLYALGCLATLCATDRLPFQGSDRAAVLRAQCLAEVPPLEPIFAVPTDFEDWVRILLAKRPRERFELCADALYALRQLGPADRVAEVPASGAPALGTASTAAATLSSTGASSGAEGATRVDPMPRGALAESFRGVPPLASAPRRAWLAARREDLRSTALEALSSTAQRTELARAHPARHLGGIGLGVYGLRTIPLAGRHEQRGALLHALDRTLAETGVRAVVLHGRAGYGKSRVAEWLVADSLESGRARAVWVPHDANDSRDGVARMLVRLLRAQDLERSGVEEHLREVLPAAPPATREQLAEMLAPRSAEPQPGRREERFAIAKEALAHQPVTRPTILVFDDAQHAPESIAFVDYLLRLRPGDAPAVLALLTVRDEALEGKHAQALALARLSEHPRAERLEVGPLPFAEHERLVAELLGLAPSVAERVAARTDGNPLFAVQLVGDWVQRGLLVARPEGFVLAGEEPPVPDDIHSLWTERIDRAVAHLSGDDTSVARSIEDALGLAAILGLEVHRDEWERACAEAGVHVPEGLLDALAGRRLARVGRRRFSLVHGMLTESLVRRARERGRAVSLHAACAAMLAGRYGDDAAHAERRGWHLAESGSPAEAVEQTLRGAELRFNTADLEAVYGLLRRCRALLDELGAPDGDPRRIRVDLLEGHTATLQGRFEQAVELLERARTVAREDGDRAQLAEAERLAGGVSLMRGVVEPAAEAFRRALALAREMGDLHAEGLCAQGLAECIKSQGDVDASIASYEHALTLLPADGVPHNRALMGLADSYRRQGDLDRAGELLGRALEHMRRRGQRYGVAAGLNSLGDIARQQHDLATARARYQESCDTFDEIASGAANIVRINLGLAQLAEGDYERTRRTLETARPWLGQEGREGYLAVCLVGLFAAAAGQRRLDDLPALHAELEPCLAHSGLVDQDIAETLVFAGELCLEHGSAEWAAAAWELAAAQHAVLGHTEAAGRLRDRARLARAR